MRVILLADDGEDFDTLLEMRKEVQEALEDAGFDVSAVGVLEAEAVE
jgi:hypothetical protein